MTENSAASCSTGMRKCLRTIGKQTVKIGTAELPRSGPSPKKQCQAADGFGRVEMIGGAEGLAEGWEVEHDFGVLFVGRVDEDGKRGRIELAGFEFQANLLSVGGKSRDFTDPRNVRGTV